MKANSRFSVLVTALMLSILGHSQHELIDKHFDMSIWDQEVNNNYDFTKPLSSKQNTQEKIILNGRHIIDYEGIDSIPLIALIAQDSLDYKVKREVFFKNDSLIAIKQNGWTTDTSGRLLPHWIKYHNYEMNFYENGILRAIYECYDSLYDESVYDGGFGHDIKNVLLYNDYNGNPINHGTLKNGNGVLKGYRKDGTLEYTMEYEKGKPHGVTYIYRSDRTLGGVMVYRNGKRIKEFLYDPTGTFVIRVKEY